MNRRSQECRRSESRWAARSGGSRLGRAGALLVLLGCGTGPPTPESEPGSATGSALIPVGSLDAAWPRRLLTDLSTARTLFEGPEGEALIALQRGDLASAGSTLRAQLGNPIQSTGAAARAALSRVHLEVARTHAAAARLHREGNWALSRWRTEHHAQVRPGRMEPFLAALDAHAAGEDAAARALIEGWRGQWPWSDNGDVWGSARLSAIASCRIEGRSGCWPAGEEAFVGPLALEALEADLFVGSLTDATGRLLPGVPPPWSPVVDELGRDADTGVEFRRPWWDPALHVALERVHLSQAFVVGATIAGCPVPRAGVFRTWPAAPLATLDGLVVPASVQSAPAWLMDFGAPLSASADLPVLLATLPTLDPSDVELAASVDTFLTAVARLEGALTDELTLGLPAATVSALSDLTLVPRHTDALLRDGAERLGAGQQWAQARRLAERSLDPSPEAARTRVSPRNDRAFLLDYARILWRSGDPSSALDIVQPLSEEDPTLAPLVETLAQLDAISTLGQVGKASQQ